MNNELDIAVRRVYELKKNNRTWSFSFIVSKVSNWNRVDYSTLYREIMRRNKKRKKVKAESKIPFVDESRKLGKREPKEDENIPWWNK